MRLVFLIKGRRKGHYRRLPSGRRVWVSETTTKVGKKASSPKKESRREKIENYLKDEPVVSASPLPFGDTLKTLVAKVRKLRDEIEESPVECPALKDKVYMRGTVKNIDRTSRTQKESLRKLRLIPVAIEILATASKYYRKESFERKTKKGKVRTITLYTFLGKYRETRKQVNAVRVIVREIKEVGSPNIYNVYLVEKKLAGR